MFLRLPFGVPIKLKEGATGIRWVELHTLKAVDVVLPSNPHPEFGSLSLACLLRFQAITLTNDHIAAVSVSAFQKPTCRRLLLDRRDNFKEIRSNRKERVFQPEGAYALVDKTDLKAENGCKIFDHRSKLFRH